MEDTKPLLNVLEGFYTNNKAINCGLACRALLSVDTPNHRSEQEFRRITIELIKALQSDPNTSPDFLLEIEWKHFDALNPLFGASPKTIEHSLTSDPTYFCRVIEIRYRFRFDSDVHRRTQPARKRHTRTCHCHAPIQVENTTRDAARWKFPARRIA